MKHYKNKFLCKSKKAQVGLEAIVSVSLILFLFLGAYLIYYDKNADIIKSEQELNERAECFQLANLINNIYTLGDNTEITTKISQNMTIEPGNQRIYSEKSYCTFPLKMVSQNSTLNFDAFTLQEGNVSITNENGLVIVNNV
ncbi:MAG: hypothetical protein ABIG93_04055 [archaeon]